MNKERLQITNDYAGIKCYWLKSNEKPIGRRSYSHPDCEIYIKGRRDRHTDYHVMLKLQDLNMPVIALRYEKRGAK